MRRAGFFTAEFYRHLTGVRALPPDTAAGRRRRTTSSTASRSSSRSPRPTASASSPSTATRSDAHDPAAQGDPARAVHAVRPADATGRARSTRRATPPRRRSCRSCAPSSTASSPPARRSSRSTSRRRRSIRRPRRTSRPCSTRRWQPVVGRVRLGAHLCFGNYLGPAAGAADVPARPRRDARLPRSTSWCSSSPTGRWPRSRSSARSPPPAATSPPASIDVKNSYIETADDVAERIDGGARRPASRPSGSRSSPTAASARPPRWPDPGQAHGPRRRPRPGARTDRPRRTR